MNLRLFKPSGNFKAFRIKEFKDGKFIAINKHHPEFLTNSKVSFLVQELTKLNSLDVSTDAKSKRFIELKMLVSGFKENQSNERLVQDYFNSVISKRKIKDSAKGAALMYLNRAAKAVGNVSLHTGNIDSIQESLDTAYPDQRQRQLAMYLNCLLRFVGRSERVEKNRLILQTVDYIPIRLDLSRE